MSTSDSSDSDPGPDLEADYRRVTGENPGGSEAINCDVGQIIKESVETSANIPQIKVVGTGTQIYPGTQIHIHQARETSPPADEFLENIEERKRLEKIVGGIRDYYHTVSTVRQ